MAARATTVRKKTARKKTARKQATVKKATARQATRKPAAADGAHIAGVGSEAVAARTGRSWEEWLRVLDRDGARALDHKGIVALVAGKHGVGAWWAQMVTVGYEQARGLRAKHQKPGGFEISASRTLAAPLAKVYRAWSEPARRRRWLGRESHRVTTATTDKSLRLAWDEDDTRVSVNFYARGADRCQVAVQHGKLPSAAAGERRKKFWKERLQALSEAVE